MHLKRKNMPKFWTIRRKGSKYLAVASHNTRESIPIVFVIRDILKLARNSKEVKRLLSEKQIKINHKNIYEVKYPVCLFDVITFEKSNKSYKATLSEKKKMEFVEVSGKEAETKVYKIANKKIIGKNKTQINLKQGRNIIIKENAKTGDSLLINLKDGKVIKVIPMEKGNNAFITEGKHAGKSGKIEDIIERGGKMLAKINAKNEKVNVWTKNIIITQ